MKPIKPCISSGVAMLECQSACLEGAIWQSEVESPTVSIAAHLHQTRADAQKEYAILLVLGVELGHDDVQSGLRGGVKGTDIDLAFVGQVKVRQTCGNGDDLLDLAFQDKRKKEVEEMDVSDNVSLR